MREAESYLLWAWDCGCGFVGGGQDESLHGGGGEALHHGTALGEGERERERESEIENEKARETPTREKMSDSQRLVRRETRNDKFLTLDSHSSTLKIDKS